MNARQGPLAETLPPLSGPDFVAGVKDPKDERPRPRVSMSQIKGTELLEWDSAGPRGL